MLAGGFDAKLVKVSKKAFTFSRGRVTEII